MDQSRAEDGARPLPHPRSGESLRHLGERTHGGNPVAVDGDGAVLEGLLVPADPDLVGGVNRQQGRVVGQLLASSLSSGWAVPPSIAVDEMWDMTRSSTGSFA